MSQLCPNHSEVHPALYAMDKAKNVPGFTDAKNESQVNKLF